MPSASVTVRIDENLKKQAEILFNDMGLNMTTAFNLFVKAVVRQNKIPFEIVADPMLKEAYPIRNGSTEEIPLAASAAYAAQDSSFIKRTIDCQEDFEYVDSEAMNEW